jgi:hypothetical protein
MLLSHLPFCALCLRQGYHALTVKSNHSVSFTLANHLLVLTLHSPPPDSLVLAVIDHKNVSQRVDIAHHTHVAFFETTLAISAARRDFRLSYWLLPANVCGSVSYWAVADHQLHFEVRSQSLRSDFCIFSQSGARTLRAALDYQSDATGSRVEFFSDPDEPARRCRPGMVCSHSSDRPVCQRKRRRLRRKAQHHRVPPLPRDRPLRIRTNPIRDRTPSHRARRQALSPQEAVHIDGR